MLEQLELKIIYTLSNQKIYTKDIKYENRRRFTISERTYHGT